MTLASGPTVEGVSPRPWASAMRHVQRRWHALVTILWMLVLALSPVLRLDGVGHDVALAAHLLGMVVGFGAVLLVDWHGLVWLSGLRTFRDSLRVGEAAHPLVWMGLLLILVSGAFLGPDLGQPTTWIKQVAVLALVNNGVAVRRLGARLSLLKPRIHSLAELPERHRVAMIVSLTVSQIGWWTAAIVGYLETLSRR
ncbi:hypothetical protein [Knoellia subterranea]|nr:hypothetical protein [Knoellia subterranea]